MSWICFLCNFQSREWSSGSGMHRPLPAVPGAKGRLRSGCGVVGRHWGASWGHLYPLQVTCVLQSTPDLLGSVLSPFRCRFPILVPPAKLLVQDVTFCLLLSQKFTSSFFISRCWIPGVKRGFHAFIWNCKPVLSLQRYFYQKISTAANFPKSQTIITHLVLDRGFFWIFPPDPMIKPSWFEIEDSFISPWQLSLLLPTILPNLFKQHPAIKATWQAFKALG